MIHSDQIAYEIADDWCKTAHEVQIWYLAIIGLHMRLQKVVSDQSTEGIHPPSLD